VPVVATVAVAAVECVAAVAAETEADVVVDVVRILRCDSKPASSNANIIQADSVAVTGVDVAVECVVAAHPEVVVVTAVAVVLPVAVPAQRAVLRLSS
jgi:hypothetical protein